jgi:hypothetical protein
MDNRIIKRTWGTGMKGVIPSYQFARAQDDEITVNVGQVMVKGRINSLSQRRIAVELLEPFRCEETIGACLPSKEYAHTVHFQYSEIHPSGRQVLSSFGEEEARELTEDLYLAVTAARDLRVQMQELYNRAWKLAGVVVDSTAAEMPPAVESEFVGLVFGILPENVISPYPVVNCWMRYFRDSVV